MPFVKKLFNILAVFSLCITLGACATKEEARDYVTVDQLNGSLYIKKGDRFYPFATPNGSKSVSDFIWTVNFDEKIPVIEPDDEIVLHTTGAIPEQFTVYSLTDFGYTAGMLFAKDSDGDITFKETYCPNSVCQKYYKQQYNNLRNTKVLTAGDVDLVPKMIHSLGFLKGLEKDTVYNISFYQGTEYHEERIKADSHVWIKDKSYVLKNYQKMKDKYFVVSLPQNMTPGYWFIDGYGMFYLEEDVVLTGEDMKEVNTTEIEVLPDESILDEDVSDLEITENLDQEITDVPVEPSPEEIEQASPESGEVYDYVTQGPDDLPGYTGDESEVQP